MNRWGRGSDDWESCSEGKNRVGELCWEGNLVERPERETRLERCPDRATLGTLGVC